MRYFLGIICTVSAFLLGDLNGMLIALVVLMGIDMLTGIVAAGKSGELSSRTGLYGIARKIMILSIVIVSNMIDQWAGIGSQIRELTILFYLANEIISIAENCAKMGIPLPDVITKALASMTKEAAQND